MRPILLSAIACAALSAATPQPFFWGEHGHRIVGELAAELLPADMPEFFRNARARLTYLNPEPDRWRDGAERRLDPALDQAFYADHFIDLEMIPPDRRNTIFRAPSRYAYIDSLRTLKLDAAKVGFSPFAMLELTQRLRSDFRRWRAERDSVTRSWIEQRIIDDAGILGHFVADASNPAHTTMHYDRWVGPNPFGYTTEPGFHARFETEFVQAHVQVDDVRPLTHAAPKVLSNVRAAIGAYLQQSNDEVEHLYQLDKRRRFDARNDSPEHKHFAAERLAAGAVMLRDIWWTAWVTSAGDQ